MSCKNGALAIIFTASLISSAHAQQAPEPAPRNEPDYSVRVWGYFDAETLRQFEQQLRGYLELRNSLQTGLPMLRITINPNEINRAETLLARRIRAARATARQGDIFVSPLKTQIKHMFVLEADAHTMAVIMDDNPGEFSFSLNAPYPKERSLSTVPANILALLPGLESGVEYRFVGRHLILRDTQANVIIDTIPYALNCHDCVEADERGWR